MSIDIPPHLEEQTECCRHLAHLREHATSDIKHIMAVAEYMEAVTDTLSDDLKPTRQALIEITMHALIESYAECLKLISELGLQKIARAAQRNQRSTPT
jgi:hypothetical protein